MIKIINCMR